MCICKRLFKYPFELRLIEFSKFKMIMRQEMPSEQHKQAFLHYEKFKMYLCNLA